MQSPPRSLDLDHLRRQAQHLLRAFREGKPQARLRVQAHLPRFLDPAPALGGRGFLLADALLVVAREHGFASWPRLKAAVDAAPTPPALAAAAGKTTPRTPPDALATQLVALAAARDAASLAREFSRMPRRDILAVRRVMVEQGTYPTLVDALLVGLSHPSPRIRHDCAHALDHFADERCIEPLRRLLNDPVPRVRRVALHVLSCETCKLAPLPVPSNDDLVARVVAHALRDPSINVRRHATIALAMSSDNPRARDALTALATGEHDPAIRRYAVSALRPAAGCA